MATEYRPLTPAEWLAVEPAVRQWQEGMRMMAQVIGQIRPTPDAAFDLDHRRWIIRKEGEGSGGVE